MKKLEVLEVKEKATLYLTESVVDKIKYLCNKIDTVEWSGTMFYKILEGDIQHPESLVMEAVDIFPQDKGSAAHTQFKVDESIMDLYDAKPELEDCRWGISHSHNTMSVFFSGTDMSELEDNCPSYDFYLSLIVNNKFETCAKIAVYAKQNIETKQKSSLQIRGIDGNPIVIDTSKDEAKEQEIMITINVNVIPRKKIIDDKFFIDRVDEIIRIADTPKTPVYTGFSNAKWANNKTTYPQYGQKSLWEDDYSSAYWDGGYGDAWAADVKKNPQDYKIENFETITDGDAQEFLNSLLRCKQNQSIGFRLRELNIKYGTEDKKYCFVADLFDIETNKNLKRLLGITLGQPVAPEDVAELYSRCSDVLMLYAEVEIVKIMRDYLQEYIEEAVELMKTGTDGNGK